ncbi:MAG: 2-polyprenyl-3-methyl-5-hydroxy-6-metoxy-1, 4-benzoquinol methylase [Parcubacteria group bacterium GW2011_GWC2_45_7]|nr:MAG: 2-polyprenyl-3-methyl-5-hydroxy-6-metoxy-1, 4-benzoquinol methylase [Parcubacteria group bacterium GW2011_GWC2_45_7]KKU74099.1 MAG: 2-polyprenyl-3-methyl-5-hydroxy-6-metoxy-1, 4-benzoquinol methylase [Parcubacteria group bacterium GW2011_GWA2_47_26]
MNNTANYTTSFGFQWLKHAKTQLDSFVGLPISRKRLFLVTSWPERMEGQRILEAGSGAGRFTEVLLSTGAEVWSFDSSEAVEANRANNGHHKNLHLFRADIFDIPKNIGTFDKVLCLGVIQHTPDPKRAFLELTKFVKPGGEIVIDVYKKTIFSRLQWKYFLRPFTRWIPSRVLYLLVRAVVALLLPFAVIAHKFLGSIGTRLFPIASYPTLGLPYRIHKEWSVLDTFDMYSPRYDNPQTLRAVRKWFKQAGLKNAEVRYGPNGIIGRGRKS